MQYAIHVPYAMTPPSRYALWVFLHGAGSTAQQAAALFGAAAATQNAILLAPQATRACGDGFCWSFAADARAIQHLLTWVQQMYPIDLGRISVIGYSMGCTMGMWLLARQPMTFTLFAALGMGSAFEPWEHDDGGIDERALCQSAVRTHVVLAVDQADPEGTNTYFADNYRRLQHAGFTVTTFRPREGTHAVTEAMRALVLQSLPRSSPGSSADVE